MAASASSWKHDRFTEGRSIPYKAVWNDDQFALMSKGLIPKGMEDKRFIYYDAPHLFICRSWTGQPVYRLAVVQGSNGYEVTEALSSIEFAAEAGTDSFYQAKLLDFLLSNLLLGESKLFPLPPGAEEKTHRGALQHAISGTGYGEQSHKPKKPWWRVW